MLAHCSENTCAEILGGDSKIRSMILEYSILFQEFLIKIPTNPSSQLMI